MRTDRKRILMFGGRFPFTLTLARALSRQGHEVHVADSIVSHLCAYSRFVTRTHLTASPRYAADTFVRRTLQIAQDEKIDLILPTFEEIFPLARAREAFADSTELFCDSFPKLLTLHDKWQFTQLQEDHGFEVLDAHLIRSPHELADLNDAAAYALKPCYSRNALEVQRWECGSELPKISISDRRPWLAQQWVDGERISSYSICNKGSVGAHVSYPVTCSLGGHSPLILESVDEPEVLDWVSRFVKAEAFTGQIAFDFIRSRCGKLYALECNPRTELGVHLFDDCEQLLQAFTGQETTTIPSFGTRRQLVLGMLAYGWRCQWSRRHPLDYLKALATPDAVYDSKDLKPFLAAPWLFAKAAWTAHRHGWTIPEAFTHDYEWNE